MSTAAKVLTAVRRRLPAVALAAVVAVLVFAGLNRPAGVGRSPVGSPSPGDEARVVRVVDGDTIVVDRAGTEVRVRLLGIDTPETVKPDSPVECFGPEASARTHELLDGQSVLLEADPTQDATDAYGRALAYVWVGPTLINEVLVAEGYAREYTYDLPGTRQPDLLTAQDAARTKGLGLWSAATCGGRT